MGDSPVRYVIEYATAQYQASNCSDNQLAQTCGQLCSNSGLRENVDRIPLDRCTAEVMNGAERCDSGRGTRR